MGILAGLKFCGPLPLAEIWSEWQDLNLRPSGPKPDALPNCATLGYNFCRRYTNIVDADTPMFAYCQVDRDLHLAKIVSVTATKVSSDGLACIQVSVRAFVMQYAHAEAMSYQEVPTMLKSGSL